MRKIKTFENTVYLYCTVLLYEEGDHCEVKSSVSSIELNVLTRAIYNTPRFWIAQTVALCNLNPDYGNSTRVQVQDGSTRILFNFTDPT